MLVRRYEMPWRRAYEVYASIAWWLALLYFLGVGVAGTNFDPLVITDGIAPTNDPILQFRSAAYAVSFAKRLSGQ